MKHAKQRTHARLQRRRRKVAEEKVAKVLQEVRAEIQRANMKKRQRSQDPPQGGVRTSANHEAEGKHGDEQVLGQGKGKATEQNEYECPYCQAKTQTVISYGKPPDLTKSA